jgi:hypothetical protein
MPSKNVNSFLTVSSLNLSTASILTIVGGELKRFTGQTIVIDSSGNVGIGTTSPTSGHKLTISAADSRMDVTSTNTTSASLRIISNNAQYASIDAGLASDNYATTKNIVLQRNGGNVGIGTTSPAAKLDVVGEVNLPNGSGLKWGNSGNYIAGSGASNVVLLATNSVERLRIDASGNVGIGMTPTAQLELSTDSAKKPSTNTWTIASDQRLKTNITNADNDRCYEIVKQVPLKRYTWKSEVYSQEQVKDRSKLGWIAQDVEAVFPKAVGTNRFAYNQVFEDVVTPELDSDGNTVLDENGVAKTKTEKRLVSEDVIEDCKDLNSDQIYAAMYGTIQKLIEKVEFLESKVATLEAA